MEDNLPLTDKLEFEVQTDILTLLENVKCQSSNTPVLKQALCALATICNSNANSQDYFCTVGGLDLLTDMLLKGTYPQPALSSTLFCLASAVNQNVLSQNVILNEDMMLLIHSVLTSEDSLSNNVKAAAFLLSCIIDGNGKGQWLANSTECLHDLINLIKHLIAEHCTEDADWAILSRAIGVCVNNPQNSTNQQVCCSVLPHILKFISTNPDHASMHHVLSLVCFILANNAFNQERIYQCGGVTILVNFILHYMRNSNQTWSTNTITNAIAALDNCISDNEKGCKQAEDLGLVTLLLELLYDREQGQNYSQIIVLTIGHVLEYSRESCSLVSQGQGYQLLVSYLTETQDDELFKAIKYVFSLCKLEDQERHGYKANTHSNFLNTNESEYLKCQLSHTDRKHQHMPESRPSYTDRKHQHMPESRPSYTDRKHQHMPESRPSYTDRKHQHMPESRPSYTDRMHQHMPESRPSYTDRMHQHMPESRPSYTDRKHQHMPESRPSYTDRKHQHMPESRPSYTDRKHQHMPESRPSYTDRMHQHMPKERKDIQSNSSGDLNGVQDLVEFFFEAFKNTESESSTETSDTFQHPEKSTTKSNFGKHVKTSQCPGNIAITMGKTTEVSNVTENIFLHPGKIPTNINLYKPVKIPQCSGNIAFQNGKRHLNRTVAASATSKCQRKIANLKGTDTSHLNRKIEAEHRKCNKSSSPPKNNVDTHSCLSQCTSSRLHHVNIKQTLGKPCHHSCPQCVNTYQTVQEHENISDHNQRPVYASNPSSAQPIIQYPEIVHSDELAAVTNDRNVIPKVDTSCFNYGGSGSVVEKAGCDTSRQQVCGGPLSLIQDLSNSRSHMFVDNMDNVRVGKTMTENSSETMTAYQDKKITDIVENMVSTLFKTLTESIQQPSSFAEQTLASNVHKEKYTDAAGLSCKTPTLLSVPDYQSKETHPTKSTYTNPYAMMLVAPCNERIELINSTEIRQDKATPRSVSNASNTLNHPNLNQKQYCSSKKVQSKQQQQTLKENKPEIPPAGSRSSCSYVDRPRLLHNVRMSSKHYNIADCIDRTRNQDSLRNSPPKSPQNSPPDSPEDIPPSPASDWDSVLVEKARNGESVCLLELQPKAGCYSSTFNNGVINIMTHDNPSRNTDNQNHYSCKKFSVLLKDDERKTEETIRDLHMYSFISETDRSNKMSPGGKGKRRRKRLPYTKEEVKNLLTGVSKMGKSWKQILCSYKFHPARTSVDLKDKYKRLMANQEDDEYY